MKTLQELQDYIEELMVRWNAPMPGFFRPIYRISLVLFTIGAALMFTSSTLAEYGLHVPGWLATASGIAGAVGAAVAKLTVDHDRMKLRDKVTLANLTKPARLQSPWYVSVLALLVIGWTYLGWFLLSALLLALPYRGIAILLEHFLSKRQADYSNRRRRRFDRVADLVYSLENWPTNAS